MSNLSKDLLEAVGQFREKVRKDPHAAGQELKDLGLIDDEGRLAVGKLEDDEAIKHAPAATQQA